MPKIQEEGFYLARSSRRDVAKVGPQSRQALPSGYRLAYGFYGVGACFEGKRGGRNCTFEELLTFFVRAGKTNIARRGGGGTFDGE